MSDAPASHGPNGEPQIPVATLNLLPDGSVKSRRIVAWSEGLNREESTANARLIAAAPDLLALVDLADEVERLANRLAVSRTNDERNPIIVELATAQHNYKEARAAIAKAEGRA